MNRHKLMPSWVIIYECEEHKGCIVTQEISNVYGNLNRFVREYGSVIYNHINTDKLKQDPEN